MQSSAQCGDGAETETGTGALEAPTRKSHHTINVAFERQRLVLPRSAIGIHIQTNASIDL